MAMFMLAMVVAVQAFNLNLMDLFTHTKTVIEDGKEKTVHISGTRVAKKNHENAARKHDDGSSAHMLEGHAELERHKKSEESGLAQTDETTDQTAEAAALHQVEAELEKAGVTGEYAKAAAQQIVKEAEAKAGGKMPAGGHIHAHVTLPAEAMAKTVAVPVDGAAKSQSSFVEIHADADEGKTVMSRQQQTATLKTGLEKAGLAPSSAKQVAEQIMDGVPADKQITMADVEVPASLLVNKQSSFAEMEAETEEESELEAEEESEAAELADDQLEESADAEDALDAEHMTDEQLDAMLDGMTDEQLEALANGHEVAEAEDATDEVAEAEEMTDTDADAEAEAEEMTDAEAEEMTDAEAEEMADAEAEEMTDEKTDEKTDDTTGAKTDIKTDVKAGAKTAVKAAVTTGAQAKSQAQIDCEKAGGQMQSTGGTPPGQICIKVHVKIQAPGDGAATGKAMQVNAKVHVDHK